MSEPVWIADELALAIHDRQLVEHGGAEGLRDDALLQSALGRPLNHFAYESTDIVELAAKYTAGIVQNHPFVDGNKRTGFVVGVLFLELNGYRFTASEEAAAQAVLELAAGRMDERGFCEFLRANSKRT
ncbi:MAG: type II toxin-antitoxin system death-on-curing family toxin [Steroidobacteraceae bacterium]